MTAAVPPLVGCQLWWARTTDVGPEHDALLDEDELRRRARLRTAGDRQRATTGMALARVLLGIHAGRPGGRLRVDRTCPRCGEPHGKPRLPDVPDLHHSVAHSGGWVAVAVRRGAPVGVDVEGVGSWTAAELHDLALVVLAPEERAVLAGTPAAARAAAFATYWTRKEAVVKATGAGLLAPLDELVVSPPSAPPRVLRWPGSGAAPPILHAVDPPAGCAAALALAGPAADVVVADAGPVLRRAVGCPG
ncbi:4-phosphopantetheinyl transferase [Blastococcus sp. TF02-09]|uniref:4'-phosphopantetheinyl transferase family protein n=1 Tax=Blastococcus sp. TF02-09 TaxID=2250576 RepID=UPI000DEB3FC8|nr:4'-phosphopantetheinyl transferase superfamily protein [Blastococcus sp. TF02-9]RBY79061.1 4-phosphopantetheinyl transferase [Blastococcus sp. TF02-9]